MFDGIPIEFSKTTKKNLELKGVELKIAKKGSGTYTSERSLQVNPGASTVIYFSPSNKLEILSTSGKNEEACSKIRNKLIDALGRPSPSSFPDGTPSEIWIKGDFVVAYVSKKKNDTCEVLFSAAPKPEEKDLWSRVNLIDGMKIEETTKEEVQKLLDLIPSPSSANSFLHEGLLPGSEFSSFEFNPESGRLEQVSDYIPLDFKNPPSSEPYCDEIRTGLTKLFGQPYAQPMREHPDQKDGLSWFTDEGVISQLFLAGTDSKICIIKRNGLNYKRSLYAIKQGKEAKDSLMKGIPNLVPVRDDVRKAQLYFNSKNVDIDRHEKTATVWVYGYFPDVLNASIGGIPFNLEESYVKYSCKRPTRVTLLSNFYADAKREKKVKSYKNYETAKLSRTQMFDEAISPGSLDDKLRESVCNYFFSKKKK